MVRTPRLVATAVLMLGLSVVAAGRAGVGSLPLAASQPPDKCDVPANAIVAENCRPGTPASVWDISGIGDPSIQGFATQISVNRGETISFKIDSDATDYRLDIYRLGHYGGAGARLVETVNPSAQLPQGQDPCDVDAATGLVDCGNWAVSASWHVPATATSGIYLAKAIREDLPGAPEAASHIVFVVRDDAGASALLFQTSDTTWQAYNNYGGQSLYAGGSDAAEGRAVKVSYNRPFSTREVDGGQDWVFNAEYPMVRFLEANGYDVSYISGLDVDRGIGGGNPNPLLRNHKVFLSVGHDEYWSGGQRARVEAARTAGVSLAFFSGNEIFWKTRWENNHRTLVCYKETIGDGAAVDPSTEWTGTWRDSRGAPEGGGRPENALTGTSFAVNDGVGATGAVTVPEALRRLRFWRNTALAALPSGDATLPEGIRGYEWDEDADNGSRPFGLMHLSSTTVDVGSRLTNAGDQYGPGTATHHFTLYRAAPPAAGVRGALVFGAGTIQWSWGLDTMHDRAPGGAAADSSMQQATINLLADMGVSQPQALLLAGLTAATTSDDTVAPVSTIERPAAAPVPAGRAFAVTGTSTDVGGIVAGVEVSTDGGATWHAAAGTSSWSYSWTPATAGTASIKVRAVDDSGNLATPVERIVQVISGDPNIGPGGPILVITNAANPFSKYYAEILRAEGLNAFAVRDLSLVGAADLDAFDVAILGETTVALTTAQVQMFSEWVAAGGHLIAMRPDKQLAGLFGLTATPATLSEAYLRVNTSSGPGAGIVAETVQFHGTADLYTVNGATTVATLYSAANTATGNPAVTMRPVGSGHAVAFAYDLAKSVVYTRQGNPAWSGQDRDGVAPIRSNDLFFGSKPGDIRPDWIDLSKVEIPQADEQQRLLANLVLHGDTQRKPLPRFWYFPRGGKAVVVMTGDDHANGGTVGRFVNHESFGPANCSVDNWECVRSTSYVYPNAVLTRALASSFAAKGFEIAAHINTACDNWSTSGALGSIYAADLAALRAAYPNLPAPATNRTHCVVWSDYDTQPQVELSQGIRLDTTYYYWPPEWIDNRPGLFTGSGMPMRFAKADGTMIDVYQVASQMTDESGQTFPFTADALLNNALGAKGYYGALTANIHTDFNELNGDGKNSLAASNAIVAAARLRNVPVISARQLLDWTDGRNESSFGSFTWDPASGTLGFSVTVGTNANGLETMLPMRWGARKLVQLSRPGASVAYRTETIKGIEYRDVQRRGDLICGDIHDRQRCTRHQRRRGDAHRPLHGQDYVDH